MVEFLPEMKTDIMLKKDGKTLIIDTKYYGHMMQEQFNKLSINSSNLYQIFTYVKNKAAELKDSEKNVSGMLLYAKTDETAQPSSKYRMSGNTIVVGNLDLNCDFREISQQLNAIAEQYLNVSV